MANPQVKVDVTVIDDTHADVLITATDPDAATIGAHGTATKRGSGEHTDFTLSMLFGEPIDLTGPVADDPTKGTFTQDQANPSLFHFVKA